MFFLLRRVFGEWPGQHEFGFEHGSGRLHQPAQDRPVRGGLAQMTAEEQALADKIKCDEWKKNRNGSWTRSSDTKISSYSFSNTTVAPGAWSLDEADVGTVLNKKCAK
jgi:hypothetical protein